MLDLKFSEIMRQNAQMILKNFNKEYRICVLGNITTNSLKDILDYALLSNGIKPVITIGNYDNIVQDSALCTNQDMVIVFYDAFKFTQNLPVFFEDISEEFYNRLFNRICEEIEMTLYNLKNAPSVIFNSFSSICIPSGAVQETLLDRLTNDLNHFLKRQKYRNLTILNIDKVFQNATVASSIDMRFFYSSKAPYTIHFFKHYTTALLPIILRNCGKLKKAIIFDCDNTLWKGILGEDGPQGIEMTPDTHSGEIFHIIQQIAVYLSKQGIIVGLCSKNNAEDVMAVLAKAVLNPQYIVISKINWTDKVTNLKEIAAELNIGIDSLVFIDDSDFEVNLVREQLPEVTTLQVPKSLFNYPNFLLNQCHRLFNLTPNEDDKKKTEQYKIQAKREAAKNAAQNMEQYLASMHIVLDIHVNNISQIERIAQLTQKTNQFNLTTHRYTETQIEQFMNNTNSIVVSVNVSDDFGDNGLTALSIITVEQNIAEIDTLLMSCRIIGRNIEYVFLDKIIELLAQKGIKKVKATYVATPKNIQVATLYDKVGFTLISTNDNISKTYELEVGKFIPSKIDYITTK